MGDNVSSDIVIEMTPEDAAANAAETPVASAKNKRLPLIAGGVAVLLAAAGGGAYMFMQGGAGHGEAEAEENAADVGSDTFVEAPAMMVNLRTADGQTRFLKIRFVLVAASAAKAEQIKAKLPIVLDALQSFLRELRPEDLNGSAAVFRVKEEMMVRAAGAFGTGMVRDILIQDLVQQ